MYEYKCVFARTHPCVAIEEGLNKYAEEGWRYVNFFPTFYMSGATRTEVILVFEREKTQET